MNRTRISLTAALLSLCLLLSGCMMPPAEGTVTSFSLEDIPAWSGEPYVAVDGNQPDFPEEDMTSVSFETYSELDTLGRCGVAYANVGQDLMPTEDRESISSVTPSGWINREYDGEYLYNRCHLIGFQLTGENANEENLITGTRYMNVDGMLPFENLVADYVKETDNHVLYRVTPVFEGQNLVASGVQMEAWSVEDEGEGVCFNVYVYNVQPGITIDYATGESWQEGAEPQSGETTYILNTNSHKFHDPDCSSVSGMSTANRQEYTGSREDLIAQGYTPCGQCNPYAEAARGFAPGGIFTCSTAAVHRPDTVGGDLGRTAPGHGAAELDADLLAHPEAAGVVCMDQDLLAVLVVADAQFAGADPQDGGAHGDCAGSAFHFNCLLDS